MTLAVWLFGTHHSPDPTLGLFGRHGLAAVRLKASLGTGLLGLAVVQLLLALWLYGRLPAAGRAPRPVGSFHRLVGVTAIVLSLPIAIHCVLTYGVLTTDLRVRLHSLAGSALYGAFLVKVLVVRSRGLAGWVLPVVGGLLICLVGVLWYTSALWYFNGYQLP